MALPCNPHELRRVLASPDTRGAQCALRLAFHAARPDDAVLFLNGAAACRARAVSVRVFAEAAYVSDIQAAEVDRQLALEALGRHGRPTVVGARSVRLLLPSCAQLDRAVFCGPCGSQPMVPFVTSQLCEDGSWRTTLHNEWNATPATHAAVMTEIATHTADPDGLVHSVTLVFTNTGLEGAPQYESTLSVDLVGDTQTPGRPWRLPIPILPPTAVAALAQLLPDEDE